MASEVKLKHCPFCGGEAELAFSVNDKGNYKLFWVSCTQCRCETHIESAKRKAVARWNRRASDE